MTERILFNPKDLCLSHLMAGEHQNDDFILYCPDEEVKEKHHVQDVQGPFVHGSI